MLILVGHVYWRALSVDDSPSLPFPFLLSFTISVAGFTPEAILFF